jgi:hypothetical protein
MCPIERSSNIHFERNAAPPFARDGSGAINLGEPVDPVSARQS